MGQAKRTDDVDDSVVVVSDGSAGVVAVGIVNGSAAAAIELDSVLWNTVAALRLEVGLVSTECRYLNSKQALPQIRNHHCDDSFRNTYPYSFIALAVITVAGEAPETASVEFG